MGGAFKSLVNIYVPISVKTVQASAFQDCTGLKQVKYEGLLSDRNNMTITTTNNSPFTGASWTYLGIA